jgi:hypothetical protein
MNVKIEKVKQRRSRKKMRNWTEIRKNNKRKGLIKGGRKGRRKGRKKVDNRMKREE